MNFVNSKAKLEGDNIKISLENPPNYNIFLYWCDEKSKWIAYLAEKYLETSAFGFRDEYTKLRNLRIDKILSKKIFEAFGYKKTTKLDEARWLSPLELKELGVKNDN